MVINHLKICWQIKYFLSKFYLKVLRWSFVWIGTGMGIFGWKLFFLKIIIVFVKLHFIVLQFWSPDKRAVDQSFYQKKKRDKRAVFFIKGHVVRNSSKSL